MLISNHKSTFASADRKNNLQHFLSSESNARLWEMMEELAKRIPWEKGIIDSLRKYIANFGKLSDKQKTLVINLYMNSCVMSDESLAEQIEVRRLGYRLMIVFRTYMYDDTATFVQSVMTHTNTHAFSPAQISAIRKVAGRYASKLASIQLAEEEFDGWIYESEK